MKKKMSPHVRHFVSSLPPRGRSLPSGGRAGAAVITHIVMWKFKDQAEGAGKAQNLVRAKALLDACAQLAPGTLRFEVAIAEPGLECTYDLVLNAVFADRAAIEPPEPPAAPGAQALHRCGSAGAPVHGL